MSSINLETLASDLNFLISEGKKDLTGVTPSSISNVVFAGSFTTLDEGFEVQVSGREVVLDTEIVINRFAYETTPEKGAVLQDLEGTKYKVADVKREGVGPLMKLLCISQYARD